MQKTAREFAQEVLKPVVAEADALTDTQQAFVMMKDAYKEAYRLGFAMGFLPKEYLITTQAKRNLSSRSGIGGVLSAT